MVARGGTRALPLTIRTLAETGSTNADLIALAAAGAEEGLWLRAEQQTAGRGRQGRNWVSPPGNLYASTIVRLRPTDPPAPTLALVASVALQESVCWYLPDAMRDGTALWLKWPNDLMLQGAKLSGILLERAEDAVVIGFGVNLARHPAGLERAVTSIAAHRDAPDAAEFLETLVEAFGRWLGRWRGEGLAPIRARWLERAYPIGTPIRAHLPEGDSVDGLFEGLDMSGALILRLASGARRVIHAGDVFLI